MSISETTQDLFDKARDYERASRIQEAGLWPFFRPISAQDGTRVVVEGREMLMVSSNDYLGLSQDERVRNAARQAVDRYATSCTGSRFLNGTLDLHEELEARLADFFEVEAVITFPAGFLGCLSVISTLADRHDILYFDRENHASLFDGARLSFGKLRKYRHNDVEQLDKLLESDADRAGGRMIVTDGVFSMSGQFAHLPEIVEVADRHGARVVVDDAHAAGLLGTNGRGTGEHFGIADRLDITVGTFSKAFASVGGFMTGEREVVEYVKHCARPFIFTAAPPPAQVAATLKALEIIETEAWRREKLWDNVERMLGAMEDLGFDTLGSSGPIVPVLVGEDRETLLFWKEVWEAGLFVVPALPPSVPPDRGILRLTINASHEPEDLDRIADTFAEAGRRLGVIS